MILVVIVILKFVRCKINIVPPLTLMMSMSVDIYQDKTQNVAVKSFFGGNLTSPGDEQNELIQIYADMRQELNKLVTVNHSNIVKCIGFCLSLFSCVLEWAPFGSTYDVMESYSRSGYHFCPESLVHTVKQVIKHVYVHTVSYTVI